jgi:hypothetical protein
MCKFFSGILKKDSKTLWDKNFDNHETLITKYELTDNEDSKKWLRYEVIPIDDDIFNHDKKNWKIIIDESNIPSWYEREKVFFDKKIMDSFKQCCKELFIINKKEYFDLPYELRKSLEREELKVDIKGILIEELFDPKFLARQNLLIEGLSLIKNDLLSERFGFKSYSLFAYSLKNLSHNEKTKFQYAFKGRRSEKGVLEGLNGITVGMGSVLIPIENSEKFKEFLDKWKIGYEEWRGIFIKA